MSLPDVASDAVGVDVETLIIIKMENAINERARLGGTKHNARLPRAGIVAAKILLGTVMTQNCISILFRSNCPVTCSNSTRLVQLNDCGFHELRYSEKFLQTPQRNSPKSGSTSETPCPSLFYTCLVLISRLGLALSVHKCST